MHYLKCFVATPGKYDGKDYKAGNQFPFDPDNPNHVRSYELGRLKLVKYTPKKTAVKSTKKGS